MKPDRNRDEMLLRLAVSITPGVTAQVVRHLADVGFNLEDWVRLDVRALASALGISTKGVPSLEKRTDALEQAREELKFISRHGISTLFLADDEYPERLRHCPDAPVMLYMLGDCNLDAMHSVGVVGTRRCTIQGVNFTRNFVKEVAEAVPGTLIASGLAFGIDAEAHRSALAAGLPTVAVVAHGLHMIYPHEHRQLARQILNAGGAILTEYRNGVKPFRGQFLMRNRIVAGLSDALMVAESDIKGGAMSTANTAFGYDREVFAVPGRPSDQMSTGCNRLIAINKAHLLASTRDFLDTMGWQPIETKAEAKQLTLFPELDVNGRNVCNALRNAGGSLSMEDIKAATGLTVSQLMSTISDLEFDSVVERIAGNRVQLMI